MRMCWPEKPKWPDTFRRRFFRAIPHNFKAQRPYTNRCSRCDRINPNKMTRPSERRFSELG